MEYRSLLKKVNIHHGFLQGFYWIAYAAANSFTSVYLLHHGFSNLEIGIVMALSQVLMVIASPVLSSAIDRSKRLTSRSALSGIILLCLLCLLGLWFSRDHHLLTGIFYTLISALLFMMVPLTNAMIMELELQGLPINYGVGRSAGSASYSFVVVLLGLYLDNHSIDSTIPISAACFALFLFSAMAFRYKLNDNDTSVVNPSVVTEDEEPMTNFQILKNYPTFLLLMVGFALMMAAHNANMYYIVHITNRANMGEGGMGLALSIAGFVEIPTMIFFSRLHRRFGTWTLMRITAITFTAKCVVYLFATSPWLIYLASALQTLEYGLITPLLVYFVAHYLRRADLVKGQSLYSISAYVGSIVACIVCGRMLDIIGLQSMLICNAIVSAIGTAIILILSIHPPKEKGFH